MAFCEIHVEWKSHTFGRPVTYLGDNLGSAACTARLRHIHQDRYRRVEPDAADVVADRSGPGAAGGRTGRRRSVAGVVRGGGAVPTVIAQSASAGAGADTNAPATAAAGVRIALAPKSVTRFGSIRGLVRVRVIFVLLSLQLH